MGNMPAIKTITLTSTPDSKYIVFSDVHRGDGIGARISPHTHRPIYENETFAQLASRLGLVQSCRLNQTLSLPHGANVPRIQDGNGQEHPAEAPARQGLLQHRLLRPSPLRHGRRDHRTGRTTKTHPRQVGVCSRERISSRKRKAIGKMRETHECMGVPMSFPTATNTRLTTI